MKYFQFNQKVAGNFGFNTLGAMERENFDFNLCWGNGFDQEKSMQLFNALINNSTNDKDADELLYFLCLSHEGENSLRNFCKTFGSEREIVNALIRALDHRFTGAGEEFKRSPNPSKVVSIISDIVRENEIPYETIRKTSYVTDLKYWESITAHGTSIKSILRGMPAYKLSAARFFIESKIGKFAENEDMKNWNHPGYFETSMSLEGKLRVFSNLSIHIGVRQAIINLTEFSDQQASHFAKAIAKTKTLEEWKSVFHIPDIIVFFNAKPGDTRQSFIYDVVASSISSAQYDVEQLKKLKPSTIANLISRGCVEGKNAVLLAGKNAKLKGYALESSLGM